MNIAWFRETAPDPAEPLDGTAALIDALRATHTIDVFVEADAHDFVWRHARTPWDLCVYEFDNTDGHLFVWGYLLNYPGVVLLKNRTLHDSRAAALDREHRVNDYLAERRFNDGAGPPMTWKGQHHSARGSWPMLRVPLLASRAIIVPHATVARALQERYPEARIRCAPSTSNLQLPTAKESGTPNLQLPTSKEPPTTSHQPASAGMPCRFGLLETNRLDVIERACRRAREAGAIVELITGPSAGGVLAESDVVIALTWPAADAPLTAALAGMAAGKAVVTFDLETTADWPALDPQTWRPRGRSVTDAPIAITIDPRDQEHSVMLAMRRLASDPALRAELGRSAHAWWQAHASPSHAAATWNQILQDAAALEPPPRPPDWPAHLNDDGTRLAAEILAEFRLGTRLA